MSCKLCHACVGAALAHLQETGPLAFRREHWLPAPTNCTPLLARDRREQGILARPQAESHEPHSAPAVLKADPARPASHRSPNFAQAGRPLHSASSPFSFTTSKWRKESRYVRMTLEIFNKDFPNQTGAPTRPTGLQGVCDQEQSGSWRKAEASQAIL